MGYFERDPEAGGMGLTINISSEAHVVGNYGDPEFSRKLAMRVILILGLSVTADQPLAPNPLTEISSSENLEK